jgi:hypothetical protein
MESELKTQAKELPELKARQPRHALQRTAAGCRFLQNDAGTRNDIRGGERRMEDEPGALVRSLV